MQKTKYQSKHKKTSYFKEIILNACLISIFQTVPQLSLEWSTNSVFGEFQFEQQVTISVS
ncbi:hypothetical protein [Photobacterium damselae]|uniref:hypothetical protein n=1 Tax=Photobacterium damselae TaxID=38293 RepID=UPI0010FD1E5F|nr:hypothetical protein [Photobacterium damselae]TLS73910.1 hypothetical protein FD721_19745 [Photobacterium damselae subsp. damselae]TLS89090.1 hypothetical protein FD720_03595 [Photobacterium damselae subsp. damselae]